MKKQLLATLITAVFGLQAQDPVFSQLYTGNSFLNPSLTGVQKGMSGRIIYRIDNKQENEKIKSYHTSFQASLGKGYGIGIQRLNETIDNRIFTSFIDIPFSKRFILNEKVNIGVGVQTGVINRSIDLEKFNTSNLVYGDEIDSKLGYYESVSSDSSYVVSAMSFNVAMGVNAKIYNGQVGFSIHNLTEPNIQVYAFSGTPQRRKYTYFINYNFPIGENWTLTPSLVEAIQGRHGFHQLALTTGYKDFKFLTGYMRLAGDGVSIGTYLAGLSYQQGRLQLNYTFGSTGRIERSIHEFGIVFRFAGKGNYSGKRIAF